MLWVQDADSEGGVRQDCGTLIALHLFTIKLKDKIM